MSVHDLHGITLESLLTKLVAHYGWDELGKRIDINCFHQRSEHQVEPEVPAQDPVGAYQGLKNCIWPQISPIKRG